MCFSHLLSFFFSNEDVIYQLFDHAFDGRRFHYSITKVGIGPGKFTAFLLSVHLEKMKQPVQLDKLIESMFEVLVGKVVDQPVDGRVWVTKSGQNQVRLIGECVILVNHDNQCVRYPT